jgi:hypothetical protein
VTVPNGNPNPFQQPSPDDHGDGNIWTGLWPRGKVVAGSDQVLPDGSISMKWWWWRGVEGDLKIVGRRLDGSSPPLGAIIPAGYGSTGFQATSLIFPREGCWEVTGSVGPHRLTFVTIATKACSESEARELVNSFLAAFNDGEVGKLDKLVSTRAFVWWSTDAPGQRIQADARERSTLVAYFADRHLHKDHLVLESFRFNGQSGQFGNFEFELLRSANDAVSAMPYVGKGAFDCLNPPYALSVWSMAWNPHP